MPFMLDTCFPSGSLKFWHMLGKDCLCDQFPRNILKESLMSFPYRWHSHVLSWLVAEGMKRGLRDCMRRTLGACTWFAVDFIPCDFLWVSLYPFTCNKSEPEVGTIYWVLWVLVSHWTWGWFGGTWHSFSLLVWILLHLFPEAFLPAYTWEQSIPMPSTAVCTGFENGDSQILPLCGMVQAPVNGLPCTNCLTTLAAT